MHKIIATLSLTCTILYAAAQEPLLKSGDRFPDLMIGNIVNAPVQHFLINEKANKKIYILNLWGTW